MTVRKGIPRQGKHRNEPLRDKMSRRPGSVPTPKQAAIVGVPAKPHGFVGRGGAAERVSFAACGETNDTQLATTRQEAFSGRTAKEKWREHMRENPYKRLPPIERRQDGSLYRMTPAQRKQANALIRRECCCYEDGNCMLLDDGDTHTCPQTISFSVCCKWFRWSVLPQIGTLEAEIFRDKELKRCAVCGRVFVPKSNRAKYCPGCAARVHRRQKTESERKRRSCVDS